MTIFIIYHLLYEDCFNNYFGYSNVTYEAMTILTLSFLYIISGFLATGDALRTIAYDYCVGISTVVAT